MKYLLAVILLLCTTGLEARELTLTEVMSAACRITTQKFNRFGQNLGSIRGTGTVIKEDVDNYIILTNGHVASQVGSTVHLEFFKDGVKSNKIPAKVVWRYYKERSSIDAAVISVKKTNLGNFTPTVIDIAPRTHSIPRGTKIYGAGCPKGMWLSAWIARVAIEDNNRVLFDMTPQGGQSGTALLSKIIIGGEPYTVISGMLTWHYSENGKTYGGGLSLKRLYDLFDGNAVADSIPYNMTEAACKNCKLEKHEHYVVKLNNGSHYSINGKTQYYCPPDRKKVLRRIRSGFFGANAQLEFPIFPRNPSPEDIDPGNGKLPDIFPDNPTPGTPVPSDEVDKLKEKIGILERLRDSLIQKGKDIDEKLKNAVEEKKKESQKYQSLDALYKNIKGLKKDLEDTNKDLQTEKDNLADDNKSIIKTLSELEDKYNGLLVKLADFAKQKEEWLNSFNIPFFKEYGGLGTVLSFILSMLASGAVGATVWSKWVQPLLVSRFGFFPAKIVEAIIKRRYPKLIRPKKTWFKTIPDGSVENGTMEIDTDDDELYSLLDKAVPDDK